MSRRLIKIYQIKIEFYNNGDICYSKIKEDLKQTNKPSELDIIIFINETIDNKPEIKSFYFRCYVNEIYIPIEEKSYYSES